jgi:uncharacterized protein (TIGR00299 family) protein
MKTLYLECNMGAAGDMLMAALLELHDNPEDFLSRLNNVGIPNVVVTAETAMKCGIKGTHINVKIQEHRHNHNHNHYHYHGIEHLIGHLKISETVKKNVLEIYKIIAEAESHVHGVPVDKIHFHEVGEMDAIADITGVCMLMEELAPESVLASPINTGSGQVRCTHGILSVPAPATARILQGIPIYNDDIQSELCTPTGAALLKYFVREFCKIPVLTIAKIGYGMGKKDFEKANCLRAYMGNICGMSEEVSELVCNLDDMTPEAVAYAQQLLFNEGALDVYTAPIVMKKGRSGVLFTCMCRTEAKDKILSLIFRHTSTLGIREYTCRRYTLQKEQKEIQTKFGSVRIKTSSGFGITKSKPEYEDIAKIAQEKGCSIREVLEEAVKSPNKTSA